MPSAVISREYYSAEEAAPARLPRRKTSARADGFYRWQEFETEWTKERLRRSGALNRRNASRLASPLQRLCSGVPTHTR